MKTINTVSACLLIVWATSYPGAAGMGAWALILFALAIVCYITRIAEKQNDPARSETPHEVKR